VDGGQEGEEGERGVISRARAEGGSDSGERNGSYAERREDAVPSRVFAFA